MRRTGFVLAAMLMVSGVAPAKDMWGTPKTGRIMGNDRGTWSPPSAAATPWSGGDELYSQPGGNSISGSEGDDVYGANINDCGKNTRKWYSRGDPKAPGRASIGRRRR